MVKKGDLFKIEHDNALYKICSVECITNDVDAKQILIQIRWAGNGNEKKPHIQQYILPYSSKELKNFHILNFNKFEEAGTFDDEKDDYKKTEKEEIQEKILKLNEKLKIHILKEEYEQAQKIQNQIDKLNKKLK